MMDPQSVLPLRRQLTQEQLGAHPVTIRAAIDFGELIQLADGEFEITDRGWGRGWRGYAKKADGTVSRSAPSSFLGNLSKQAESSKT